MRSDQIDAYRTTFAASVRAIREEDGASWVTLSDSLFYPTSGGQPHDVGTLRHAGGEGRVVDVEADGPDAVLHRVEGAVPAPGDAVEGAIDWDRRYRHMQRHSAQHLLSQAFLRVDPAFETRSVALTSADATIDLAGDPDDAAVAAAFDRARAWAYAALPIEAFEVDEAEVASYPLRRPPKVSGRIRLVRMGDVELSACGGTHLRSTAEMLPLLALGRQRIRGGLTRVTFRAGIEAGDRAARTVALADELARSFSARWEELPERVEALRDEVRAARAGEAAARAAWARLAVEGAASADGDDGPVPVLRLVTDDPAALAALAEAAAEVRPAHVALLAARTDERATLLFQAGPEAGAVDVRPALQAALAEVEGRGGGAPDRAQGAGPRADRVDAALDAAVAALTKIARD
jgi:alanyl-tRNA synthetase